MREGLHNVAHTARVAVTHPVDTVSTLGGEAARVAGSAAHLAVQLAGTGARAVGGVAEAALSRAGLVGREGATETIWDADRIEDEAAEAVARQEARDAATTADEVQRVAAVAEEREQADEGDVLRTPSGIPAADEGFNPHTGETDLVQPDTADPGDEGAMHAVESEAEILRRAAQEDKS